MNRSGFSLTSLLVTAFLSALLALGSGYLVRFSFSRTQRTLTKGKIEEGLRTALEHMMKTGLLAQSCSKISASVLECLVDFGTTASNTRTVRFSLLSSGLSFTHLSAGNWIQDILYDQIATLEICADAEM